VEVDAVNVPVAVAGVQIKPGDLIRGDATGVVVIPQEKAGEVLAVATEIAAKEALIEQEIENGKTLREARAQANYHSLQTRREE
jgi:4-hydroxy-4-methyl-2-oxoglutarate aldolase